MRYHVYDPVAFNTNENYKLSNSLSVFHDEKIPESARYFGSLVDKVIKTILKTGNKKAAKQLIALLPFLLFLLLHDLQTEKVFPLLFFEYF